MKRKVVIRVSMNCPKSRSRAMEIAVGASGVESAAIQGEDHDQIEVTGEEIDAVKLTLCLRKKMGFAEVLSVSPEVRRKRKRRKKRQKRSQYSLWFGRQPTLIPISTTVVCTKSTRLGITMTPFAPFCDHEIKSLRLKMC